MKNTIDNLRGNIDLLDDKLLNLLAKRIKIAKEIGLLKKKEGLDFIDTARKAKVLDRWIKNLRDFGVSETEAKKLYNQIHDLSVNIERGTK